MKDSEAVLCEIEAMAKSEFLPIIGRAKAALIEKLVVERAPRLAVEIGVLIGYSAILIARNLAEGSRLIGMELSTELAQRTQQNLVDAGLATRAVIYQGDARELLSSVNGPVDFALFDAEKTQNLNYLKRLEPNLAPGAIIVANNAGLFAARMASYLDYVRSSENYESSMEIFGDDAMEISRYRG